MSADGFYLNDMVRFPSPCPAQNQPGDKQPEINYPKVVSESIRKAQTDLKMVWESPIRFQKSPRNGLGKLEKQPKWSKGEPEPQNQPRNGMGW